MANAAASTGKEGCCRAAYNHWHWQLLRPERQGLSCQQSAAVPIASARTCKVVRYRAAGNQWHWRRLQPERQVLCCQQSIAFSLRSGVLQRSSQPFTFDGLERVLGVGLCLKSAQLVCILITNTEERRTAVAEANDVVLQGRHVASSTLVSLRGRLLFAENQVWPPCGPEHESGF